jgi:hypothetical protein
MARCRDANFRLVNSFSVRGVQEISTRVASSQHAALSAAFDAPEKKQSRNRNNERDHHRCFRFIGRNKLSLAQAA